MRAIKGTAGDPEMLDAIDKVNADNVRFAMLWRELMKARPEGPMDDTEALRLTAKAAAEDWLEGPP